MAEAYYDFSPYNYVRNNPIALYDPNGMYDLYVNGKKLEGEAKSQYIKDNGLPEDTSEDEEGEGYTWDRSRLDDLKGNPLGGYAYYTDPYAYECAMTGKDNLTAEEVSKLDDEMVMGMLSVIPLERALRLYKLVPQRLRTKALKIIYNRIGATGRYGERILGALGGESQVFFKTTTGSRYIDQLVSGIAHESKVGYTSLTKSVKRQILKDVELMQTGQVNKSIWHFFRSPVTGKSGASKPLVEFLNKNGIDYVVH